MRTHPDYHPDYGIAAEMSASVVPYAEEHGVVAAAAHFKLARSTVYRWRADARATSGGNQ